MSNLSFLNFQYGISIKPSAKQAQSSISKERQCSNTSTCLQLNVEEMRRVFDKFDSNKDGKLSKEEFKLAQRVLLDGGTVPETETAKEFQMIDSDGDGFIDFKEFMEIFNIGGGVNASDIQSAFRVYDLDGDGRISAEELLQILKKLGEVCSLQACRKMVKAVDTDGDGFVDINEFMSMMAGVKKRP
ncbi:hypothetical protein F2P56_013936 [Juglans regia]|uniref:EF-hand domain-containing protein n=2 Tax=Juglans regia TaxID=51240 RepID=A0A833XCN7_JUGRE|nr:calmodulin-like protein 30 [Juglans regia]KAF5463804.1 hypothetical protein F2P56_013936 [Juglans regia]